MRKVFMLFLFLPIILYGQEKDKEIITFYADQEAYILTANTNRDDTSFHLELAKNGKVINEKIIPLTGRCPIEKDIHIESFDNGFTIRIPYCEGYLFRLGKAGLSIQISMMISFWLLIMKKSSTGKIPT